MKLMPNFDWFANLNKPKFSPPDWLFAPVWSVLYVMIFLSLVFFVRTGNLAHKILPIAFFVAQLVLNLCWSPVFFGMKNIQLAFVIIVLMWICILGTIVTFYPHSKVAALLLVPYFIWVSFAVYLNFSYLLLN